jgi:hypothetical protein
MSARPMSASHHGHATLAARASAKPRRSTRMTASKIPIVKDVGSDEDKSPTDLPEVSATESRLYVPPQPGQRNLSLNVQPPAVQALIKVAIHSLTGRTLFKDAYLPSLRHEECFRNLLSKLVVNLELEELGDVVQDDGRFMLRSPGYAPVSPTAPDEQYRRRCRERPIQLRGNSDIMKERSQPIWLRHYDSME